jgi:hypothetical protein
MLIKPLPGSKFPPGEPPYSPAKWNNSIGLTTHNCYSYALNDLHWGHRKYGKPQPSWANKLRRQTNMFRNYSIKCSDMEKGIKADNPETLTFLSIKKGEKYVPPPFHYKALLLVSPGNDFHFARQDNRMLKVYSRLTMSDLKLPKRQLISKILKLSQQLIPEIYELIPKSSTPLKKLRFLYKYSKTWSHKPGAGKVTDKDADGKLIFNPLKSNWNFGSINYNKFCKFFIVPMNTHAETFSTGIPSPFTFNKSLPTGKSRLNISAATKQQLFDKKVSEVLRGQ